jgi:dienelactone hydrolase
MRRSRARVLLLFFLTLTTSSPSCGADVPVGSREVTFPSADPTGNPTLDRIWVRYFPAVAVGPAPAVVLVPPVGSSERDDLMRRFAEYLARHGIGCAVLCLPYHGARSVSRALPSYYYAGDTIPVAVQAFGQAESDVSTTASWLAAQPDVDPTRLGAFGVSLGAIIVQAAMGRDPRLRAGVALLGGGDLPDIYKHSVVSQYYILHGSPRLGDAALAPMSAVDPLTFAAENRPRRVLMIEAARDLLIPPRDARELWHALGEPPIQWLDTDHFALLLNPVSGDRATVAYLQGVWAGLPDAQIRVPRVYAPTLKFGLLDESGVGVTPALQWQFLTLLSRPDHLSLLSLNVGLTGHGLFTGLALTVTPFIDVGLSPRLDGRAPRPYLSLHLVY